MGTNPIRPITTALIKNTAVKFGLPKNNLLLETQAKNSGENTIFTKTLLEKHGIDAKRIIVIQKPYAERRTFATIKKQWPEVETVMSSPQLSYEKYINTSPLGKDRSIGVMG